MYIQDLHKGNTILLKRHPWCFFCYHEITAIEVMNIITNMCKSNLLRNVNVIRWDQRNDTFTVIFFIFNLFNKRLRIPKGPSKYGQSRETGITRRRKTMQKQNTIRVGHHYTKQTQIK